MGVEAVTASLQEGESWGKGEVPGKESAMLICSGSNLEVSLIRVLGILGTRALLFTFVRVKEQPPSAMALDTLGILCSGCPLGVMPCSSRRALYGVGRGGAHLPLTTAPTRQQLLLV